MFPFVPFKHLLIFLFFHDLSLALLAVLNMKFDQSFCILGLLCSSFVSINAGTHGRSVFNPLGNCHLPHVALGNILATRKLDLYSAYTEGLNAEFLLKYTTKKSTQYWYLRYFSCDYRDRMHSGMHYIYIVNASPPLAHRLWD